MNLKDMFLHTPVKNPEYMKVPIKYFPKYTQEKYELSGLIYNGRIYIKIKKDMYGLKQAAVLAYAHLSILLKVGEYQSTLGSIGIRRHKTRKIVFCLCVDKFGSSTSLKKMLSTYMT